MNIDTNLVDPADVDWDDEELPQNDVYLPRVRYIENAEIIPDVTWLKSRPLDLAVCTCENPHVMSDGFCARCSYLVETPSL